MGAAVASFALFSVGALVPVLPFLLTSGTPAIAIDRLARRRRSSPPWAGCSEFLGTSVLHSARAWWGSRRWRPA